MRSHQRTTNRQQTWKMSRFRKEFYRQLVEESQDPMWVHFQGIIVYANRAAITFFAAASVDELLGNRVLDFVHPDDRESVKQRIRMMYVDGAPVIQQEARLIR